MYLASALPIPLAAFSVRRVVPNYVGPAMEVRRDLDNAKMLIYFTPAGDLDTDALEAFAMGGKAYVTTWFDQSGGPALVFG